MKIINKLTKIKMFYLTLVLFLTFTLSYYLGFSTASKILILLFLLSSIFGSFYAKTENKASHQAEIEVRPVEQPKTGKLIKEEVIAEP